MDRTFIKKHYVLTKLVIKSLTLHPNFRKNLGEELTFETFYYII